MNDDFLELRKAESEDIPAIWEILQESIERRRKDGSDQWQDGYPNLSTVENDVEKQQNYVLTQHGNIIATAAVIFTYEPTYDAIDGQWLTKGDADVVHRVGVSDEVAGEGIATQFFRMIEEFVKEKGVFSIKIDTNFDNLAMLRILEKLNYTYCGEILVRNSPRKAFEKVLSQP